MRIRRDLPQFNERRALLIVTGRFAAELYVVYQGTVERLDGFQLVWPKYEDNEGFFEQRGRGMTRISGSVRERKERERVNRFILELRKRVWKAMRDTSADVIVLFSVKAHQIERSLQDAIRRKIIVELPEDVVGEHPFVLLDRIKKVQQELESSTVRSSAFTRRFLRRTAIHV